HARQQRRGAPHRRASCGDQGAIRRLYADRVRGSGRGVEVGSNPADGHGGIDRDPSGHQRDQAVLTDGGSTAVDDAAVDDAAELEGGLREHWWAAVASITRRTGDLEIAEDAVQEACAAAVGQWRQAGIPPNPRAWLITTARHKAIDLMRRDSLRFAREAEA